jgi:signal transduction histidine kinase
MSQQAGSDRVLTGRDVAACSFFLAGMQKSLMKQMISRSRRRQTLAGSRIEQSFVPSVKPVFVHADASQFETSIINLVVNARDAMENSGRLSIVVKTPAALPDRDESG